MTSSYHLGFIYIYDIFYICRKGENVIVIDEEEVEFESSSVFRKEAHNPPVVEEPAPVEPTVESPVDPTEESPVEPVDEESPVEPVDAESPVEPVEEESPVEPVEEESSVEPVEEAEESSFSFSGSSTS